MVTIDPTHAPSSLCVAMKPRLAVPMMRYARFTNTEMMVRNTAGDMVMSMSYDAKKRPLKMPRTRSRQYEKNTWYPPRDHLMRCVHDVLKSVGCSSKNSAGA